MPKFEIVAMYLGLLAVLGPGIGALFVVTVAGYDIVKRPVGVRAWVVGWLLCTAPAFMAIILGTLHPQVSLQQRALAAVIPITTLPISATPTTLLVLTALLSIRSLRPGPERRYQGGVLSSVACISLFLPLLFSRIGPYTAIKGFWIPFVFPASMPLPLTLFILLQRGTGSPRFRESRRLMASWLLVCGWWSLIPGWAVSALIAIRPENPANGPWTFTYGAVVQGAMGIAILCTVLGVERRPKLLPIAISFVPLLALVPVGLHAWTWHRFTADFPAPTTTSIANLRLSTIDTDCIKLGALVPRIQGTDCKSRPVFARSLPPNAPLSALRDGDQLLVRGPLGNAILPVVAGTDSHITWDEGWVMYDRSWTLDELIDYVSPLSLPLGVDADTTLTVQDYVDLCTRLARPCRVVLPPTSTP